MSTAPANILEWTPEYSVNVAEIDREHRIWFSVVNRLHAAMLSGKGTKILGPLLAEVTDYTRCHFAHEENLMAAARYPAFREHVQEHKALRQRTQAFTNRFQSGEAAMTIEFTLFLSEWIKGHTMSRDRRLGEYLISSGYTCATTG